MQENDFIKIYSSSDIHNATKKNIKDSSNIINNLDKSIRDKYKKIKNDNKTRKLNIYKIFRLFYFLLTKATDNGLNDNLIKVSKNEYLTLFSSFDKTDIKETLQLLIGLNIEVSNTAGTKYINVFSSIAEEEQERGYIKARFTDEFYEELRKHCKKTSMYLFFNKNLFAINIKHNPHSFMLGMRIFYNKRTNIGKARENEITIKSLLDYCYIDENTEKYKDKQLSYCIKAPIERDLNKLVEMNILSKWEYKEKTPTNFQEFYNSSITYTITNFDELKQISDLKEKKLKGR